jgi:protein gp37
MHDIWNPWHGCVKYSEGCDHCYVYFLDKKRGRSGREIYRTKAGFEWPLARDKRGAFKVKSGETLRVCMTSDFFLPEADQWRDEAWSIIAARPDVKFFLLTKRATRIAQCLPHDWGDGWDNVMLNVSCENDAQAKLRAPILLEIPAKHKGIMCAPFIGKVNLSPYLETGQIEQVLCGGENYDGARPCNYDWVLDLRAQCELTNTTFTFFETGTRFIKDGRLYTMPDKTLQSEMAWKSGVSFKGRDIKWNLHDPLGLEIPLEHLYVPKYRARCEKCGSRPFCNGCSDCGACE